MPTSLLLKDPELATLVKDTDMSLWLAPGRHIIGYLIVCVDIVVLRCSGKLTINDVHFRTPRKTTTSHCCTRSKTTWRNLGRRRGTLIKCGRCIQTSNRGKYISNIGNEMKMGILTNTKMFLSRVQKLLALIYSTYLWKLVDRTPISNWVHESGKVLVIGDACHPVLVR